MSGEVLARVDASAIPSGFALVTHDEERGDYSAAAAALGPRLALNVGYGVSRLVRVGLGAGADFALNLAEDQNIPSTEIDGWMRWFVGPTVGFRFGPRLPLELEASIAFAHLMPLGSQSTIESSPSSAYDFGSPMFGMLNGAILYYRPYGARSPFAIHGGLNYGWTFTGNPDRNAAHFSGSLIAGLSLGL